MLPCQGDSETCRPAKGSSREDRVEDCHERSAALHPIPWIEHCVQMNNRIEVS